MAAGGKTNGFARSFEAQQNAMYSGSLIPCNNNCGNIGVGYKEKYAIGTGRRKSHKRHRRISSKTAALIRKIRKGKGGEEGSGEMGSGDEQGCGRRRRRKRRGRGIPFGGSSCRRGSGRHKK